MPERANQEGRRQRVRHMAATVGVLIAGMALTACASSPKASAVTGPKATVLDYVGAVQAHQWAHAASVLSPSELATFTTGVDSDRNTRSVTNVQVKVRPAPFAEHQFAGYSHIHQALVTYDAASTHVETSPDGPQTRFIYLGQIGASGPWRIVAIGTGP